ncbi:MAG: hydrolase family protein [Conexibacter sp.]|nr:hydrolase family protein [Conexibacter sp.]
MRAVPRMRTAVALVAAALSLTLGAAGAAPAAQWVGLGDSYAAGPLIPNQSLNPLGCLRSDKNFAHLAAASLGRSLTDVSCSGAKTDDMTAAQNVTPGPNPPQFNALNSAVQTVSLQIGGNDIGFTSIIENCAAITPFGHPCQDQYDSGGVDQLAARIDATAPKVAAVLQGIHARSPGARVLVVAYMPILPETGSGCWPQVPLAWGDVPYLRATEKRLNTMLAQQAAANGAVYVDAYSAAIGKDACKSSGTRWVEPLVPGNAAAPFHPNARGMAGITPTVVAAAR